jgi:hypothetical protein
MSKTYKTMLQFPLKQVEMNQRYRVLGSLYNGETLC